MDVLSDLLRRARAGNALIRKLAQPPPWSLTYVDAPPLSLLTAMSPASIRLDGAAPVPLAAGDIALLAHPGRHTVADQPDTPPQVLISNGHKHFLDKNGERGMSAPRTYGHGSVPTLLRASYELRGEFGERLLDLLPPLAVVPAGPRTRAALDLLAEETARDEPGQEAVLHRLLDLVLVLALRAWCARDDAPLPAWYRALGDPAVGEALRLLHEDPAYRWTVAALAAKVGLSRAALAARFRGLVGEPPLAYLTGWRMALAAEALRDTDATVAAVAREVGYADAFAFSVAFKRIRGTTPSAWRAQAQKPVSHTDQKR